MEAERIGQHDALASDRVCATQITSPKLGLRQSRQFPGFELPEVGSPCQVERRGQVFHREGALADSRRNLAEIAPYVGSREWIGSHVEGLPGLSEGGVSVTPHHRLYR